MNQILYVGNILSCHGLTPTAIEWLAPELGTKFKVISVSNKKNSIYRLLDMVSKFLRNKKQIDIVLIDTYSTNAFYYAIILSIVSKYYKIPYLPILRGGDLPNRLVKSPNLSMYLFNNAYINISPSRFLEKIFCKHGYNVKYIPNFISINQYPFKKRKKFNPKILWVRSFHEIYNPLMAIKVLYILKKQFNNIRLCMVGPSKDSSFKKINILAEELSVGTNLELKGKLSKSNWIDLSREYDIFINTTDIDNQPMTVIEAMALGLPIVSTNAGGMIYLIQDKVNGILVPKSDYKEMALTIKLIIEGEIDGQLLSDNARKKVEKYDQNIVIDKWVKFLNVIINE